MTRRSESISPVPEAITAAVKVAFPKGNLYVALYAEVESLYRGELFAELAIDLLNGKIALMGTPTILAFDVDTE